MTHPEFIIPIDVLTDETTEQLTPEQRAELWRQEISELGQMLPADSGARYSIDGLERSAREWPEDAQRTANNEAQQIPTQVSEEYGKYKTQAEQANAPYARQVHVGNATAPIAKEFPTAQMMDNTLATTVPKPMNLFASPFQQTPREATVARAHQQTVTHVAGRFQRTINELFAERVDPAVETVTQATPAELADKITEQLAESTDEKISPALDELREAIVKRREIGIGSTAITMERARADAVVSEAINRIRQALLVPSLYSSELSEARAQVLQNLYGLPTPQELANRVAGVANRARDAITDRLFKQIAHLTIQHNQGIDWQYMNVSPIEPVEKPTYQTEVDTEIEAMRKQGLSDDVIHRRLVRQYHPEATAHGGQPDPDKIRYISGWYADIKAERKRTK